MVINTLKRAEVFLGLEDAQLERVAALPSCRYVDYAAGAEIFRAGAPAVDLYVLDSGQVNLVIEVKHRDRPGLYRVVLQKLTTGSFFGCSALIDPSNFMFSAFAGPPSHLLAINGAEVKRLFEDDAQMGYRTYQYLSHMMDIRIRGLQQVLLMGKRQPFFSDQSAA